MPSRM